MEDRKHVVFNLAGELYGLPIESVERILTDQKTTKIPRTPKMVLGVFELRGETIAAVDLRQRFGFPEREEAGNFVVALTQKGRVALRVDGVDGIYDFSEENADEAPQMIKGQDDEFLAAVGKQGDRLVVLLEPDHVLPAAVESKITGDKKKSPALAAA